MGGAKGNGFRRFGLEDAYGERVTAEGLDRVPWGKSGERERVRCQAAGRGGHLRPRKEDGLAKEECGGRALEESLEVCGRVSVKSNNNAIFLREIGQGESGPRRQARLRACGRGGRPQTPGRTPEGQRRAFLVRMRVAWGPVGGAFSGPSPPSLFPGTWHLGLLRGHSSGRGRPPAEVFRNLSPLGLGRSRR